MNFPPKDGLKDGVEDGGGAAPDPSSRLARKLGTWDAVIIGLGSMIGAGVFSAVGPATRVAGNAVLLALALAGALAYCNATSSARLAALYPQSGGAYVYGRNRLGPVWGFLAGWAFVVGKLASAAAMALTFGHYAAPDWARPLAVAAVGGLTALNHFGIRKTMVATKVMVGLVIAALGVCLFATLAGETASWRPLWPLVYPGSGAVLKAAGLLFFAFAGYARIATLGEEVVNPARTIPRAIPAALGLALLIYAVVIASALAAAGSAALAASAAPLADAILLGRYASLAIAVRLGATVASLGVLLSLMVGISRTVFAMAATGDLPVWLAAVHAQRRVPHRAEPIVGVAVSLLVLVMDVGDAIAFSSFTVLIYYAVTNAASLTLSPQERRGPRSIAVAGLSGCLIVAASLPLKSVLTGLGVLIAGLTVFAFRRLRRPTSGRGM